MVKFHLNIVEVHIRLLGFQIATRSATIVNYVEKVQASLVLPLDRVALDLGDHQRSSLFIRFVMIVLQNFDFSVINSR